tara:strand:+ start:103 stop:849 length:747 start_codon:yes stop_codon:yes gene_type:complete
MIKRKNIIILADTRDEFSIDGIRLILQKKYFKIKAIIVSKKNQRNKKKYFKKIKFFYDGFPHKNHKIIKFIKDNKIELCINVGFKNRVRQEFLRLIRNGIFNIHPAVLPFNKGSHSTFYTIMNNSPLGATLHLMNKNFDSGPIVDQIKLKNNLFYDANYVFKKSREFGLKLLKNNLKKIYLNKFKKKINKKTKVNYKRQIFQASTINHNKTYSGRYIWNLIRAVHFNNNGFYIKIKNKKIKIIPKIIY